MNSEKLRTSYIHSIKAVLFIIPFIPLFTSWLFIFPYIEFKNYAFRILVEIAAVLWLGLIVLNREYRPKNTPLYLSILLFLLIVGIADLLGVNPYKSFWSDYERMEGYITLLHLAVYFMILRSVLRTQKDWTIFFNLILIAGVCVSLHSLYHKLVLGWEFREYGTIGLAAFLSSYLLLTAFVGLKLFFSSHNRVKKCLYFTAVLLNIVVIYFTATRGAIIALYSGTVLFCFFYIFCSPKNSREKLYKRVAMMVVALCIVSPVAFLFFYKLPLTPKPFIGKDHVEFHETLPRFGTVNIDRAVEYRFKAWNIAWEGFKKRPILGWGQENFISTYIHSPVPFGQTLNLSRPHNIILQWMVDAGILGMVSYILIFGVAFYSIWTAYREKRVLKADVVTLVTALFVYITQNLFLFDTISSYILFFTFLSYIDTASDFKGISVVEDNSEFEKKTGRSISIALAALVSISVAAYFIHYKPMRESIQTVRVIYKFGDNKYSSFVTVLEDINKALSFNTFGDTTVRDVMLKISNEILRLKLFEIEGALEFINAASKEIKTVLADDYYNLELWVRAINFYHAIAVYEPAFIDYARTLIDECKKISPQNQWTYLALADNFILKKDYIQALKTIEKAVALNPQNADMQSRLVLAGILNEREDVVNNSLENIKQIRMLKDNDGATGIKAPFLERELIDFAWTSVKVKKFDQAIKFYEELIAWFPGEAKYHIDFAEIYLIKGDKINALKEADMAIALDPIRYKDSARIKHIIDSLNN